MKILHGQIAGTHPSIEPRVIGMGKNLGLAEQMMDIKEELQRKISK